MLKKIFTLFLLLGFAVYAQAFDKERVNLDKEFWGVWTLYHPKTKCVETFEFQKPGKFTYKVNKKQLIGGFAVVRSTATANLDILLMNVETDNKLEGCQGDNANYSNTKIQLALKWVSPKMAEICTDAEAKKCTSLYLTKKQ